jgi:hypothetical protein
MAIQKLKIRSASRLTYTGARCDLYAHKQALDTSTPSGRASFRCAGLCRVRARHDLRTCQRRALRGQDEGQENGPASDQAVGRRAHTRAPGRRHGHSKDRPDGRSRHHRGTVGGAELELRHEQGDRLPIYGPGRQTHRTAEGPPLGALAKLSIG